MSSVKETLKKAPTMLLTILTLPIMLLNIIGGLLSSFIELCCITILIIIAICCFALIFLFSNLDDKRYRVNYLIIYMTSFVISWFLAIYPSHVQSFLTHFLSSLALLMFILLSSLLPVMICYGKHTLSWRDLLIGLRLVITTSEEVIDYILRKLTSYFILLMPTSIIFSYLLAEAPVINIQQIPFNTLVFLILNFTVVIAVLIEIIRELPKLFPGIREMLGRKFYFIVALILLISVYYLYSLSASATNQKLLEYGSNVFYSAKALLGFLFFFMSIATFTKCRNKVITSA